MDDFDKYMKETYGIDREKDKELIEKLKKILNESKKLLKIEEE